MVFLGGVAGVAELRPGFIALLAYTSRINFSPDKESSEKVDNLCASPVSACYLLFARGKFGIARMVCGQKA